MKIFLIIVLVAGLVVGAVSLKTYLSRPVGINNAPIVNLKANNTENSITISSDIPVTLSWNFADVSHCQISSDSFVTMPIFASSSPGMVFIGNIAEKRTYILDCLDSQNKTVSDSVVINVEAAAVTPALNATSSAYEPFKNFQYNWTKNLYQGMKDDQDVIALQTVLFLEGFFSSSDQITGTFDDLTFEAVKKIQEAYGIEPTGFVGPKTVAKLNELYGAGKSAHSPGSSLSSATPPKIFGEEFNIDDYLRTTAAINLRDDNCRVTGTVPADALLKIISSATKFCLIGGKNYQMRMVQSSTGQAGWLAAVFLKKTGVSGISSPTPTPTPTTPIAPTTPTTPTIPTTPIPTSAPSTEVTVNLSANNRSYITVSKNSSVILSWTSKNANSCNAYGGWSGNKFPVGSELISNLTESTYYALTCSGDASFASDSVNVFVSEGGFISDATSTISETPETPDTLTPGAEIDVATGNETFGGMVTNRSECSIPPQNYSIQLLSPQEGRLVRFIWTMGTSQLQNVLQEKGNYVPFGIPETGMWLLGELGDRADCWGAGGPGKVILFANYGFK